MNELRDISGGLRLSLGHVEPSNRHGAPSREAQTSSAGLEFCSPTAPEANLLLACARTRMDFKSATMLRGAIDGPIDWNRVIALAGRHRVRPLLHAALASARPGTVPQRVTENLQAFASANARRNLFLIGELSRLLDLLDSKGITAIPFKGPTLAMQAYGNTALREAGDLDLLVRRRDALNAKRLLVARGFRPAFPTARGAEIPYLESLTGQREARYVASHCEHHLIHERGAINIDLHWALALREFALPLKSNELWSWFRPHRLVGREVLGFGPEELLIVLCINGGKDCWERLDRICDISELLRSHPDLDWMTIFKRANAIGCGRMVLLGLHLASELLGAELDRAAADRIRLDKKIETLTARVRPRLFTPSDEEVESATPGKALFHLALRERPRDRIAYILAQFEPTVGDWAAFPLPDHWQFLHYLTRPIRLAARFSRGK